MLNLHTVLASVALTLSLQTIASGMANTQRSDVSIHTFADPLTFAGALNHRVVSFVTQPAFSGETVTRTFQITSPDPFNITWTGDTHLAVTLQAITPGTPPTTTLTSQQQSIDGLTGSNTIAWDRPRTSVIEFGHHVYRQTETGRGGIPDDSAIFMEIAIRGDWSTAGTQPGGHVVESINGLWTVERNFEFDGSYTIFRAHLAQYINDGLHNVDITYSLHGIAAVPEPSEAMLLLIGLACVGGALRARRATSPERP